MELFLIVFAKSNNQEKLVQWIGGEISEISTETDVKYFFGEENIVFKFSSNKKFSEIRDYFKEMFCTLDLAYILSIYSTENMSFFFPTQAQKFFMDEVDGIPDFQTFLEEKLNNFEDLNSDLDMSITNLVQELSQLDNQPKTKTKKPTLDELLDKINTEGLPKLSQEEINLLNEYSKNI